MALDRTWYNTLKDDDGSGLTGSVWDKEDVNQLMNAIDAQLASGAVSGYPWTDYTPYISSPQGIIFTVGGAFMRYQLLGAGGKLAVVEYSIEGMTFSFAASQLWISLPFPAASWGGTQMFSTPIFVNGVYETGYGSVSNVDVNTLQIGRNGNQNIPASTGIYFRGQFIYRPA